MRWTVVVSCLIAIVGAPVSAQAPPAEMPAQVEMVLQCLAKAGAPDLRVTLRNTGKKPVNLVLGMTLGNGRIYDASAVNLDVRQRGSDMIEVFQTSDGPAAISGRMDPWILPLPVGAEFSITRPLGDYGRNFEKLTMSRAPMDLRVRLVSLPEFRPKVDDTLGPGLVHVLPGNLQSAWIRVPEDCRRQPGS